MKLHAIVLALSLCAAVPLAAAETVRCPDLAVAVQAGTCPAEEDLRYSYHASCSDDARMYRGDNELCADYRRYRKVKNVVLWESADGAFQGYVSCDVSATTLRQARAASMSVGKQGKITRLACSYGEGVVFSYRSRGECKVEVADCTAGNCTAECQ
jgi:hypothetical protein